METKSRGLHSLVQGYGWCDHMNYSRHGTVESVDTAIGLKCTVISKPRVTSLVIDVVGGQLGPVLQIWQLI